MRPAPTLAYAAIALALIACGSGPDDEASGAPTSPAAREENAEPAPPSASAPPAFSADFSHAPPGPSSTASPGASPAGATCNDPGDPGSAETLAKALPDTDDCNDDHQTVSGIANGSVDVDFYSLAATDRGISLEHPFGCHLDTDFSIEGAGAELCVFVRCKSLGLAPQPPAEVVTGCDGGTLATSDVGMRGCCATASDAAAARAVPKWDCSGFLDNESSDFFLRVRQPAGNACLPYTVSYRF